jgi:ribosomal protein S12 methylthiotransferase accessory factor
LWIQGVNLMADEPTWVPYESVHTDFRLPQPTGSGCFPCTSNGLASGNHRLEALSHALCEVIERDATTLWRLAGGTTRDDLRLDPTTVDDPACRHVLDLYAAAGVVCGIWETTSDIGVPCFWVMIVDGEPNPFHPPFAAAGMGCHPAREVALLRALTEAAQGRLTFISGARDDVSRTEYTTAASPEILGLQARAVLDGVVTRSFLEVPTHRGETFDDDVEHELRCLAAVGIAEVAAFDLSLPELRIPVARVVVPGLEGPEEKIAGIEHGARARALLAAT